MSIIHTESASLASLEATIERGLATFVEVGEALATIRDERLYLTSHSTFEAYCIERWGFTRSRAHRLIEAAEVVEMLPTGNTETGTTVPVPTSERQARELAPLKSDPPAMAEAMTEAAAAAAAEGRAVTAADVREAVKERKPVNATDRLQQISKAERVEQIRERAARGMNSKQIADAIGLGGPTNQGERTVRLYAREAGITLADDLMGKTRRHNSDRIVNETVSTLEGAAMGIGLVNLDDLDPDQLVGWVTSLSDSMKTLAKFHKQLKEMTHDRL